MEKFLRDYRPAGSEISFANGPENPRKIQRGKSRNGFEKNLIERKDQHRFPAFESDSTNANSDDAYFVTMAAGDPRAPERRVSFRDAKDGVVKAWGLAEADTWEADLGIL